MLYIIWKYLGERQSTSVKFLHVTVLLLVLSQILMSEFIEFTDAGEISKITIEYFATWIHIITGLSLLPFALIFAFTVIKKHGLIYFYPYLWKDFVQIRRDIDQLKKFELPEPNAKGLAPAVQGLGLGALLLVLLSGASWYLLWSNGIGWAENIGELHELFTGLIEVYIVAHGSIGLLHIYYINRSIKSS